MPGAVPHRPSSGRSSTYSYACRFSRAGDSAPRSRDCRKPPSAQRRRSFLGPSLGGDHGLTTRIEAQRINVELFESPRVRPRDRRHAIIAA